MTFLLDHDVPDDLIYSLRALGHEALTLRSVLEVDTDDATILQHAANRGQVLITCNRDDFLMLAQTAAHCGMIIVIRRRSRTAERAALVHLLDRAGEAGIVGNINYA